MKRKWIKRALWVLLTPTALFILLMVLLYVPPVQDFIQRKATAVASDATGMRISVERIDLRFPLNLLVRGVLVMQPADSLSAGGADALQAQPADTLLALRRLNVHVQLLPLLRGRIEVDAVQLQGVSVHSAGLIEGMSLSGDLGSFFLESHGIDLSKEEVVLNRVELSDTRVQVVLTDTAAAPEDTAATDLRWRVKLHDLRLKEVSVDLQMPPDSLRLQARVGDASLSEAVADLGRQIYGWQQFRLSGSSLGYDSGLPPVEGDSLERASRGFDPSHIALRGISIGIDSVLYAGRNLNAVIRECALYDRSGLSVNRLEGRLFADSSLISIPAFRLSTPHSEVEFSAQTYWELVDMPTTGHLSARLNARIGKQDVMLLAGGLPEAFKEAYPFHPLVIRAGTEGNLRQMQITRFTADLPGAFAMTGGGELWNLTDSLARSVKMDFDMRTQNLNFLTGLAGMKPGGAVMVPDSMHLALDVGLEGQQCTAALHLYESDGRVEADAAYDLATEEYRANLHIDSLQLHHFLPQDSLYLLTARFEAKGRGTDLASPRTTASAGASLQRLRYGQWDVSGVDLRALLHDCVAKVDLASDNALLKMRTKADLRLDRTYLDGKLDLDVDNLNLYRLGMAPRPLPRPFAFTLGAEARHDSIKLSLDAGDLDFRFRAHSTLKRLLEQSDKFLAILQQQIDDRRLDHAALRRVLPSAGMHLRAGTRNPVAYFLSTKEIAYDSLRLSFGFTPQVGINGRTAIHGLRMDSLQLDTIFFAIRQDTARMTLQGGVVNGPKNPQFTFRSTLTGEIRNEDAELTVNYTDEKGETGVLLGLNARPLTEGNGKGNGMLLRLVPDEPVLAFRKFRFADGHNWIYLHKNMRVYANVDMGSDEGLCFRMQSNPADTVSLQNINLELSRLQLSELSKVLPYLPRLSGLFSAEANYIQTPTSFQISAEAGVEKLTYERQPVGDVGIGATWLPGDKRTNYLNSYFTYGGEVVMTADGTLTQTPGGHDSLSILTALEHFPLKVANAFVPDRMLTLAGDLNGQMSISGSPEKPEMQGEFSLDSASVHVRQANARYWFDNRPIRFKDNQLLFDKFAIYTTSANPFTIDGNVDFRNLERPTANLTLLAKNYTLLDAARTRESLVYGKVFVDLNATVRGPLDGLAMRGRMNLLGNTNVTYVLTDSPLTVEDRLDGLVTFVSFSDTTTVKADEVPVMSLGGLEMYMSVHIDDAVRLRADLSTDRSKYIELEGGGDLNLQYTPQGDMSLTGRYTLSGGVMKYSLPIIPLKEFQFNPGSYVDWRGDIMNPMLDLKATERIRASVDDGNGGSRMVNFDVSIIIKNRLGAPDLAFDISAPEDATVENELQAMGAEERNKQAIAMLATGVYLNSGVKGGGLSMGAALNSVIQSQINSLAGSAKNASISVGVEDNTSAETGDTQKDFSFRYSQRFFNDRVQIVIGGKVSTGANATNNAESFIDNISLEYRLDTSGTRYVRAFYNKNNESILDGEITETGVGLVLRRKMDRLGELFIFKKR